MLTEADMLSLLEKSYSEVVESRGRHYQEDKAVKAKLHKVAAWMVGGEKASLLLFGGVGNGKTTTAYAIYYTYKRILKMAKELDMTKRNEEEHKMASALLGAVPSFTMAKSMNLRENPSEDILIVDDFGEEPTAIKDYGTEVTPLCDILSQRYDSRKPVILTSNLDTDGILQKYGRRIHDRLKETCELVFYSNDSYR